MESNSASWSVLKTGMLKTKKSMDEQFLYRKQDISMESNNASWSVLKTGMLKTKKSMDEQLLKHGIGFKTGMLKAKKSMDEQLLKHGIGFKLADEFMIEKMITKIVQNRKNRKEEWQVDPTKLIIKTLIARGAFGSVFFGGYHDQNVAVKILEWGDKSSRIDDDASLLREAFLQEVSIWYKLDHPNIVKFIGAATDIPEKIFEINGRVDYLNLPNNIACIVLEYLFGGTLKTYLVKHRDRKLPFKIVVRLALDLAQGLSYLHSKKIVHRDIKPDNMLLHKDGTLKITDFGIARVEPSFPAEMTSIAGTRAYMAPEVLSKKPYNRKCDVYSFGICLWQIYCCDIPYQNVWLSETPLASGGYKEGGYKENPRPKIPKCCPKPMKKLMKRCWQTNPVKRPEMAEVVSILQSMDTSKGGGMLPAGQQGCLFFRPRGP